MRFNLTILVALFAAACASNNVTVVQNTANGTNASNNRPQTVTAHTTEGRPPMANSNSSSPGKWTASGDPIDTAKFDGTIVEAEKVVKSKPNDEQAKKTLAQAYFDRGFALTEARQYASATGDFRRALKLDPAHEESKKWLEQIVGIYKMLKKEPPKEGEEPPPLPYKKGVD
jgi:tetratricopeptide (TPR) repeat protein